MKRKQRNPQWVIGWREWLALPDLGIPAIKAKIDTGARTSALHAFEVEPFRRAGKSMVRFVVHPKQRSTLRGVRAESELLGQRNVRNSGGQVERRPVILASVQLNERVWTIELTLTNRDEMGFRMLLGRQGLRDLFLVDPARSFLAAGRPPTTKKKGRRH